MSAPDAPSPSPDLLYSDVEEDLRAAVRGVLADRCPPAAVLARCESGPPYDLPLWHALAADVGVAGLRVPESAGGQGGSARELAVCMEELGAAVAPVPVLGSVVLATTALLGCDDRDPLDALLAGERVGALTVPLTAAPGAAFPAGVRADAAGG